MGRIQSILLPINIHIISRSRSLGMAEKNGTRNNREYRQLGCSNHVFRTQRWMDGYRDTTVIKRVQTLDAHRSLPLVAPSWRYVKYRFIRTLCHFLFLSNVGEKTSTSTDLSSISPFHLRFTFQDVLYCIYTLTYVCCLRYWPWNLCDVPLFAVSSDEDILLMFCSSNPSRTK